jgi:pyruvate/2-oxoglutarate dehydrogenase complex dihydrolipoamide dehydrogenase (E3) component
MPDERFDVIIIGAGQGGGPLSGAFPAAGRKTALIERKWVGGTCINTGCTPTKTMVASARVAHLARRAGDYGVRIGDVAMDMPAVRQRKRDVVMQFRSGSEKRIRETEGLEFIEGEARFVAEKTVEVALNGSGGTRTLSADIFVLDTGERPRPLEIDNPDGVTIHDSTTIMELGEVPDHLVVVGGGSIGLEFGQLFRRLGAEVTIVHHGPQLLSREDPDIVAEVTKVLEEDGIAMELDASPASVAWDGKGLRVTLERNGGGTVDVRGSHLLAAVGRVPNTEDLDIGKTGLSVDRRGYIPTDDRLETTVPGIYAIGDIRPGPKFTHISYDDYRIITANLIDGGDRRVSDRLVPYTTFVDPQLGRVGLSEREARDKGWRYLVGRLPMSSVARAIETDETRGVIKVLVDPETGMVLGAAVLAVDGGELMAMLQIAMMGKLPYTALRDGVFSHPSLSEALNSVFASLEEPGDP